MEAKMKNLLLLTTIILFVGFNSSANAQWYPQTSRTTNNLSDVSFTDADNGTAVGYYGTILRTTDGEQLGLHNQAEHLVLCMVSPLPMQITGRLLVLIGTII